MKGKILKILLIVCLLIFTNSNIIADNKFPLLKEETQKEIINQLGAAIREMAIASRPVGGDSETYWAASVVDSLQKTLSHSGRSFMENMTTIHHMNSYFAYGMNYFSSVIGLYSCPKEAGYARYSVSVCDSLANNAKISSYEDVLAIADLGAYSYYYTQLYVTMLHKINGHSDFVDNDLGFSLRALSLLKHAKSADIFTENDVVKIYFVLDAVSFYKTYCGYLLSLTYDIKRKLLREKLIEYAYYIDEISSPVFDAIYSGKTESLKMTDQTFEEFMIKMSGIKVDMMARLTSEFISISEEKTKHS